MSVNNNSFLKSSFSVLVMGVILLLGNCLAAMTAIASADLVVVNGDIRTVDKSQPRAQAFAVKDGKFLQVGDNQSIKKLIGKNTKVVDAKGKTLIPGLVDGHTHLHSGIDLIRGVDLYHLSNKKQWLEAIAKRSKALPEGAWLLGGRWDYTREEKVLPRKEDIDAVVSDRPVFLVDVDYHSAWVNSKALALAGITKDTKAPEGGEILLDPKTGEPTGVLTETAMALVVESEAFQKNTKNLSAALGETVKYVNSRGITSVQDMAEVEAMYDYLPLLEKDQLSLRVWFGAYSLWGESNDLSAQINRLASIKNELTQKKPASDKGPLLDFGYIKVVYDGVLSIYTAALKAPYSDKTDTKGTPFFAKQLLVDVIQQANAKGFPVSVHAIGDESVNHALAAFAQSEYKHKLRNRIEHIELVDPADIKLFKDNYVTASMQPNHGVLGDYILERIGSEREPHAYAWKDMLVQGVHLVLGSDWPTATLDPLTQLGDAVLRQRHGKSWQGHNALTFDEALYAYTQAGADMAGWGEQIGSIAKGKWADFVMLDGRLPETLDQSIRDRKVLATYLAGESVYGQ